MDKNGDFLPPSHPLALQAVPRHQFYGHHRTGPTPLFFRGGIEAELEANEEMVTEPRVRVEGSITLIFSSHSPPLLCFPTTPLPLPYKQLTDFTPAHSQGESAEEMPSRILSAELK